MINMAVGSTAIMVLLCLLLVSSAWAGILQRPHTVADSEEAEDLPVSMQLQMANFGLVHDAGEPPLLDDIAMDVPMDAVLIEFGPPAGSCITTGCLWPKAKDGRVHVPYVISKDFSAGERAVILSGLQSFSSSTCVRFRPRRSEQDYIAIYSRNGCSEQDYIAIYCKNGCYSYIGRRGGEQAVSLSHKGCLHYGTIQHELLHTLGFNHEQTRSDRDKYIRVLWDNIIDDKRHNFNKMKTLNQNTGYDYNSVMQYHMYAFSKNKRPTMVPVSNQDVDFGRATEMSDNDILRVNKLYKCHKRKRE